MDVSIDPNKSLLSAAFALLEAERHLPERYKILSIHTIRKTLSITAKNLSSVFFDEFSEFLMKVFSLVHVGFIAWLHNLKIFGANLLEEPINVINVFSNVF
jgi:hypothetical protein